MSEIRLVEPPDRLLKDVVIHVRQETLRRRTRVYFVLFCFLLLTSAAGIVTELAAVIHSAGRTGLSQLLSLLITDGGSVLTAWQDFGYSVLEALPAVALTAVSILVLVFFSSLRYVVTRFKKIYV